MTTAQATTCSCLRPERFSQSNSDKVFVSGNTEYIRVKCLTDEVTERQLLCGKDDLQGNAQ